MNITGDKTIKAGDLAMVVRDCCGRHLGTPLKVGSIHFQPHPKNVRCDDCGREYSNVEYVKVENPGRVSNAPLFWLKKIDPPAIPETEDEREELTA